MQLSSRVIKQVDGEMEKCPVQAKIDFILPADEDNEQGIKIFSDDINKEVELILENARNEAQRLVDEANQLVGQIEQEAYQKGFAKGEDDVREAHRRAQEEYYESTLQVLHEVNQLRQQIYKDTEVEILALSIDIAEKLVCRQLELKPETIVDIARAACMQAKECEMVIIYVAPDQVETLRSRADEFSTQLYRNKRLEFIADPTIKNGGCRIETEQGYIDATIETMLKQLNHTIRDKSE